MKITIPHQFQQFIASLGVSMEELLQKADIPNMLWKETLTLTNLEYYRLLQEFDHMLSDEQLLAFSQIENINMFMPPFFAAMSAKNGYEGIQRLATYKGLIGPVEIQMNETSTTVCYHFSFIYPNQELPRFALLNEQLLLVSLLRIATGEKVIPLLVGGPYSYGPLIEEFFGIRGTKSVTNQLIFKLADVKRPFLTENNTMWEYLKPEFTRRLQEISQQKSFSQNVQAILFSAIPSGHFTLEEIAHTLGISVRTLQRNLSAENTTFNQQLQAVQKMLAFHYLQEPNLTTNDIAYLLGYADSNSFVRAFKKWTGQTISEYKLFHK
ncbi:AraC family transcriptional regulator [Ectobacillus funiculus]|uniref:helix-turn-helix domain-containing protein n=1 Tax=Ectobacillus funiculus TaxID=137993 RepID=UPI003979B224